MLIERAIQAFHEDHARLICRMLNEAQSQEQAEFRKGFSCMDHIQTLSRFTEVSREYRMPFVLTFVAYEKAFDSIETNAILSALVDQDIGRRNLSFPKIDGVNIRHSCCVHGVPCIRAHLIPEVENLKNPKCLSPYRECLLPPTKENVSEIRLTKDDDDFIESEMRKRLSIKTEATTTTATTLTPTNPFLHYIGIMTSSQAEKGDRISTQLCYKDQVVQRPTSFRLYHQASRSLTEMREALRDGLPGAVAPVFPLNIIYRSSEGKARHYEVIEIESESTCFYTVDVPNFVQPRFLTISGLVRFYSTFSTSNSYNDKGELQVDVFPCT